MTVLPSYYEQLGGASALSGVVQRFYVQVLDDPDLSPYFAGTDMTRLKRHMTLLLSSVLGGPVVYDGPDLAAAHENLKITERDYGKVGELLVGTLREHGAGQELVDHVVATLGQVRPSIVAEPA